MDLQLNAAEEDGGGGGGGSRASSSSSLTGERTTSYAPPAFTIPTRGGGTSTGLSRLMNSPMTDGDGDGGGSGTTAETLQRQLLQQQRQQDNINHSDVEMEALSSAQEQEQEQDHGRMAVDRRPSVTSASDGSVSSPRPTPSSVAVGVDALVQCSDPELSALQSECQRVVEMYLVAVARGDPSAAPPSKRHRKGKHQKKRAPSTVTHATSIAETRAGVEQIVARLHDRITRDCMACGALSDVARICLPFLHALQGADPVLSTTMGNSVDLSMAMDALQQRPMLLQFAGVLRRAVLCELEAPPSGSVLSIVFDWCLMDARLPAMSWLFLFLAECDANAVMDLLFGHVVMHVEALALNEPVESGAIAALEYLAGQHPGELVDIVDAALVDAVRSGASESSPSRRILQQLMALGLWSSALLRVVDDSLQYMITADRAIALWRAVTQDTHSSEDANGRNPLIRKRSVRVSLLQLLDTQSGALQTASFHFILVLHELMVGSSSDVPSELRRDAAVFHSDILQLAATQESKTMLKELYRRLRYIAHSTVESIHTSTDEHRQDSERMVPWQSWLVLMADKISHNDVIRALVEADLVMSEDADLQSDEKCDGELCALIVAVLNHSSSDYVAFQRELVASCDRAVSAPRRRRLLSLLQGVRQKWTDTASDIMDQSDGSQLEFPVRIDMAKLSLVENVAALANAAPWSANWPALVRWKDVHGCDSWEHLLDLVLRGDSASAQSALELLRTSPFPSLEDASWQFRCLRKLTLAYFLLLKRYRSSVMMLHSKDPSGDTRYQSRTSGSDKKNNMMPDDWQAQLESLRVVITRVVVMDGSVARYPASVFTQFSALWLESLFSTVSATSVPTHFPSPTAPRHVFTDADEDSDDDEDGKHNSERRSTRSTASMTSSSAVVFIRPERTISSKCTNLQSSQVITAPSEVLVYRMALDDTWAREMETAHVCATLAVQVLAQIISPSVPLVLVSTADPSRATKAAAATAAAEMEADQRERRLHTLVDLLLDRAVPCCGLPSDDVYKESLPNRSSFDVDLRTEQWLNHFPAFLPLLRIAVTTASASPQRSTQVVRIVPLLKSALVVLLGHWNSVTGELSRENMDVPPYMRNHNQLALTCELMRILRLTGWLPTPLARTAELLPLTSPADIRAILFSCWFFLADHPPGTSMGTTVGSSGAYASSAQGGTATKMPLDFYLLPVRRALHRNMHKIGARYPLFMC